MVFPGTVGQTFFNTGRSIVSVGELERAALELKQGQAVQIVRPDGSSVDTVLKGMDRGHRPEDRDNPHRLGLLFALEKQECPVGSRLYRTEEPIEARRTDGAQLT